jgi:hypothetical protein
MTPIQFPGVNFIFKKPPSMSDEECFDLPVYRAPDGSFSVSCWALSNDELAEIQRTRRMYIYVIGSGMPPLSPVVSIPKGDGA